MLSNKADEEVLPFMLATSEGDIVNIVVIQAPLRAAPKSMVRPSC
jgi:hypothetical protein